MRLHHKKNRFFKQFRLIIPAIFALAIVWVWKSTMADKFSRMLTELDQTRKELIEENKRLKVKLERYSSISWIDSCACYKYGMTYNVKKRIVVFDNPKEETKKDRSLFAGLGNVAGEILKKLKGEK
ncbi:MAG: hypothetical protein DRP26_04590 [Candidatus Zixiibacteriota bacterium]|nr:MAG: hypothetical protein DRP26_04590 [candidate division Zixibacteria bacterium]